MAVTGAAINAIISGIQGFIMVYHDEQTFIEALKDVTSSTIAFKTFYNQLNIITRLSIFRF